MGTIQKLVWNHFQLDTQMGAAIFINMNLLIFFDDKNMLTIEVEAFTMIIADVVKVTKFMHMRKDKSKKLSVQVRIFKTICHGRLGSQ